MPATPPVLSESAVAEIAARGRSDFLHLLEGDGTVAPWSVGDRIPLLEAHCAHWGARHPGGRVLHGFDVAQADGSVSRATAEDPVHVHYKADALPGGPASWRPASGMPDWAVRMVLEVREVRLTTLSTLHREAGAGMGFEAWLDAHMPGSSSNWRDGSRPGPDVPVARIGFHVWHAPTP
jgi:hypothetical protein